MTLALRWYGPDDPVSLAAIRQIPGVEGVVTALHDVPAGEAWTADDVRQRREEIEAAGLRWVAVESIPTPERLKLGADGWQADADVFARSVEAVGAALPGAVVCYNWMPVFDWARTDLAHRRPDGSTALAYRHADLGRIEDALVEGGLPGWAVAYTGAELAELRAAYAALPDGALWDTLGAFLEAVCPAAEAAGVGLAVHPDDPPWPVFGLPRILTSGDALRRVTSLVESPANGVCLCSGSLGANPDEAARLPETVRQLGERIHFVHLRNVAHGATHADGATDFEETAHADGAVDLAAVVAALADVGFDGPLRPDHGRAIWSETDDAATRPGYGLYDRALGAAYLRGLWDAVTRRAPASFFVA